MLRRPTDGYMHDGREVRKKSLLGMGSLSGITEMYAGLRVFGFDTRGVILQPAWTIDKFRAHATDSLGILCKHQYVMAITLCIAYLPASVLLTAQRSAPSVQA